MDKQQIEASNNQQNVIFHFALRSRFSSMIDEPRTCWLIIIRIKKYKCSLFRTAILN